MERTLNQLLESTLCWFARRSVGTHDTTGCMIFLDCYVLVGFYKMQDTVWITKDKRRILVSNMETRHIRNCIAMILRNKSWRRQYLERLELELLIRKVKGHEV